MAAATTTTTTTTIKTTQVIALDVDCIDVGGEKTRENSMQNATNISPKFATVQQQQFGPQSHGLRKLQEEAYNGYHGYRDQA